MKNEDNIDDKITLSHFKALLGGLDIISNQESKIKKNGCFELHDQFINELGTQYLMNSFENYIKNNSDSFNVTDSDSAIGLILDFLDKNEIRYFYDPTVDNEENDKFDDLLSYCKDLCGRTVLSLVTDKGGIILTTASYSLHAKLKQYHLDHYTDIVLTRFKFERWEN